jgi:hypothetical protein
MPGPDWPTYPGAKLPHDTRLEPHLHGVYTNWRAHPSPTTAGAMLKAVAPHIATGIKMYGGTSASPTTRSKAKAITLNAIKTYDHSQAPLRDHVLNHLKGLQRHAQREARMLSVPDGVVMDRRTVDLGEAELADRLGRPPSTSELADHTSMSAKRVAYVRKYQPGLAQGQAEGSNFEDDDSGGGPAVEQADPIHAKALFLYDDLDPIDQQILEHAVGLHGQPVLKSGEIARKLGRSPGLVTQRATRIQAMLDDLDDAKLL